MSDLSSKKASQTVKISGGNPVTGDETNFLNVDSNGNAGVNLKNAAGTEIGSSANPLNNLIYAKDTNTGLPVQVLADSFGRLIISPLALGTKLDLVNLTTINALTTDYSNYTVPAGKSLEPSRFYGGGSQQGIVGLSKHDSTVTSLLSSGGFENNTEVAAWAAVTGSLTTIDANNTVVFAGTNSMRWVYANSATAIVRRQTFTTPLDMSTFRYISIQFYQTAPNTQATRTISITLNSGATSRTYSLTGVTGTTLALNTWIKLLGDLENPTSTVGTGFDITTINSVDIKMQDNANKSGTVYWDQIQLEDQLTPLHRLYFLAGITPTVVDLYPSTPIAAGESIYVIIKNLSATRSEFTSVLKGLLV